MKSEAHFRMAIFALLIMTLGTSSAQLACDTCQCYLSVAQPTMFCSPGTNITTVPSGIPTIIENILAEGCRIQRLSANDFKNLSAIDQITLTSNNISTIEDGTFSDNRNLTILKLNENKIETISSGLFQGLSKLQTLLLNVNKIELLAPRVFEHLSSLERLDLQYNVINAIVPDAFYGLETLVHLDLSSNKLTQISKDAFQNLGSLTSLDISGNELTKFYSAWLSNKSIDIGFIADNDGSWYCTKSLKMELDKMAQSHPKIVDCDKADGFCPRCSNLNGTSLANLTLSDLPEITTTAVQSTAGVASTTVSTNYGTGTFGGSLSLPVGNHTNSASQLMTNTHMKWLTLAVASGVSAISATLLL